MTIASDKKLDAMLEACNVADEQLTMPECLDKAVEFENDTGFGILTQEGKLLRLVKSSPDHIASYYLEKSGFSPQLFATIIATLVNAGLIVEYPCAQDAQDIRFR